MVDIIKEIVKRMRERELFKIGNRSYFNSFKYPLNRFDKKDLKCLDGHHCQGFSGYEESDVRGLDLTAPSSIIFTFNNKIWDKRGLGQIVGGLPLTEAVTVTHSAFDALTIGRTWKELVVLNGNFTLNSTILVPNYVHLKNLGILSAVANLNNTIIRNSDAVNGNIHITIEGGTVNASNITGENAKAAIYIGGGKNIVVKDVYVYNFYRNGIQYAGTEADIKGYNNKILNCTIYKSRLEGWTCGGIRVCENRAVIVANNHASKCAGVGIMIDTQEALAVGNICRQNDYSGFLIGQPTNAVTFNSNKAIGNKKDGFAIGTDLNGLRNSQLIGNLAAKNSQEGDSIYDGFHLYASSGTMSDNLIFVGNVAGNIGDIRDEDNWTIVLPNYQRYGMYVEDGIDNLLITNNNFLNNQVGALRLPASYTNIYVKDNFGYSSGHQFIVPYNDIIAEFTESDTNLHTLDLAAALSETRKIIQITAWADRISGSNPFNVYPNEGNTSIQIQAKTNVAPIAIKDGTNRLQYSQGVAGEHFHLYCIGYVVEN